MALHSIIVLGEFQSSPVFGLKNKSVGLYEQVMEIKGSSILSSVYVQSIDPGASIKVKYYDTTTGAGLGERFDLDEHDLLTVADAGTTDRIMVTKLHRRVVCEVEVTGGQAVFSVYVTVTNSFSQANESIEVFGELQPIGLKIAGRCTEVTLDETSWTALPSTPLIKRNVMAIQNTSAQDIKVNFDPSIIGFKGTLIAAGSERVYQVRDTILIYAKCAVGSVIINIEELS